jgi:mono/diheme cytochrome c family protein
MGLGGGDAVAAASSPTEASSLARTGAEAPAATGGTTPATQAEAAPPPPDEPVAPYIDAALNRKKIPLWAASVLAFLPIWAIIYGLTLDKPTAREAGPLAQGALTYSSCASCHGGGGGGGVGPALNGGAVLKTFPNIADQMYWVIEGTAGFKELGIPTYGAQNKPVGGGGVMPAWDTLTAKELIAVIRHERDTLSGEKFDPKQYDEIQAMIDEKFPARSAEFKAAIDEWKILPPDA